MVVKSGGQLSSTSPWLNSANVCISVGITTSPINMSNPEQSSTWGYLNLEIGAMDKQDSSFPQNLEKPLKFKKKKSVKSPLIKGALVVLKKTRCSLWSLLGNYNSIQALVFVRKKLGMRGGPFQGRFDIWKSTYCDQTQQQQLSDLLLCDLCNSPRPRCLLLFKKIGRNHSRKKNCEKKHY